jgi:hypothetical protein
MAGSSASSFVEELLAAPVGVTLLDGPEAEARDGWFPFECLPDSLPEAVAMATESMSGATLGSVLETAVQAGSRITGPWVGDPPGR